MCERATTIPIAGTDKHPPFAIPVLDEQFKLDGPPGDYQIVASLESGGAARCGNVRLVVMDPADLPAMSAEVVLWGEDPVLAKWLLDHGVKTVPFDANQRRTRQLILASAKAPSPGGAVVFRELAERMARGSQVVFLDPAVFADTAPARAGSAAEQYVPTYLADTRWLPLAGKGTATPQDIVGGYYRACRWAKKHPMFDGLAQANPSHLVALVDMNLLFGKIPTFLDVQSDFSWGEVVKNISRLDATYLTSVLAKHPSGMFVLPSPTGLDGVTRATPEIIAKLLTVMEETFDFVVIDGGQSIDEISLKIFQMADVVLVVSILSLPCLTNVKRLLWTFQKLGFPQKENVKVLINRYHKRSLISLVEAEKSIDQGIFWQIPNDFQTTMSGFGVGSDFSWHLSAFANWRVSEHGSVLLGFRYLDVDYHDGSGNGRFLWDVTEGGPTVGFAWRF